ncbi:restriction endonuclease subunit S [Clostridium perfringens]|nr:restriction endonuclease subunit S [Clostridium perfringens]
MMSRNVPKLRFKGFEDEWKKYELDDIAMISKSKYNPTKSNKTYKCIELEHIAQEDGRILGYVNSKEQNSIKNKFDSGDILFGKLRPYLKKYWISNFEGVCSSEIWVLKARKISNSFLYRIVQSEKFNNIANVSSGSKMPRADWNYMSSTIFLVPKLNEQEKIANFLSKVDSIIEKQEKKVEYWNSYKKGMMQKIFSQKIRFKDKKGRNYPEWEKVHLNKFVERVVRKNKDNVSKRPLTISAQYGLVDQEEFFNKLVASKNLEGYYLLKNGEFAYNKSYSTGYPFGAIKRLDKYENGAVSTLYICFKVKNNINSDFIVQYFESSKWHKEIAMIAVEGARNHGLLNVSVSDFFETIHYIPCLEEQNKISKFLLNIDNILFKENKKLEELVQWKKGLLQQMFI